MSRLAAGGVLAAVLLAAAPAVRAAVSWGTIEEPPEVTHAKWKQKAEDDYKEGMKARAAGDTANAVRILLNVYGYGRMRIDSPYPQKAADELKVITEEGMKDLAVARQLVSGEAPAAGVQELKRLTRTYFGLPPAKIAGTLLRQLEADPRFQGTLKAERLSEDLDRAQALEAEAEALAKPPAPAAPAPAASAAESPQTAPAAADPKPQPAGAVTVSTRDLTGPERRAACLERLVAAYELYGRIAQQGPETEPGKKAIAARQRLDQDADLAARIKQAQARQQAREWLGLAQNYFRAGRIDLANEYCRKVIAEFPGTPEAAEARALMAPAK